MNSIFCSQLQTSTHLGYNLVFLKKIYFASTSVGALPIFTGWGTGWLDFIKKFSGLFRCSQHILVIGQYQRIVLSLQDLPVFQLKL